MVELAQALGVEWCCGASSLFRDDATQWQVKSDVCFLRVLRDVFPQSLCSFTRPPNAKKDNPSFPQAPMLALPIAA
jgi:hypothetical protein